MKHSRQSAGQSYVEYGVLLMLIALAALFALTAMGMSLDGAYNSIVGLFKGNTPPTIEGYQTTFDGELKDWATAAYGFWKGGKAQSKFGQLELNPLTLSLLKGYVGKDYDVTLVNPKTDNKSDNWNGFGVMFRADSGGSNGYMFEVERKDDERPPQMYFSKWVDGKQYKLRDTIVNVPEHFDWKNAGNMQVSVRGDTMTAYMGGKQIAQTRDGTFTQGQVGIASNAGSKLYVDGFSVVPK